MGCWYLPVEGVESSMVAIVRGGGGEGVCWGVKDCRGYIWGIFGGILGVSWGYLEG